MTLAILFSRTFSGIHAPQVTVETHLSRGLPKLNIVGLAETAVKESKDRVRSALINSGFEFPPRRITVNLGPADLPKEGGRFDLPIALGILASSGQIPKDKFHQYEFAGELALSGEIRSVRGVLPMAIQASKLKRDLILPLHNAEEASWAKSAKIYPAQHLLEVCAHLKGHQLLNLHSRKELNNSEEFSVDFSEVLGQMHAKRALEIAASGKHSLLFIGPPGTGKTMLAMRLPTILPGLSEEEALEVAMISSLSSQGFHPKKWKIIPFRSPHHSSSAAALIGGGRPPQPGEISLAHCGVLFLDELPEFQRPVIESLREPLESGIITLSRAAYQMFYPAHFQLIAAMNPCPCGYSGSRKQNCRCTDEQVKRYMRKLSGPFLDRIDMHVELSPLPADLLTSGENQVNETSFTVRQRVVRFREKQIQRQNKCNAHLSTNELTEVCELNHEGHQFLKEVMLKFGFSVRSYHRILKVARTIADMDDKNSVGISHISEALQYRCLDRLNLAQS